MATKQVFTGRHPNTASTPMYNGVFSCGVGWSTSPAFHQTWIVAGQLQRLKIQQAAAAGVGKSWTFTIYKNGSPTALAVTISGATDVAAEDTTHKVIVAAGDTIALERVSVGTPTEVVTKYRVEFDSASRDNGYSGWVSALGGGASANSRGALFFPTTWVTTSEANQNNLVCAAGNLTELRYKLSVAPGAGKSFAISVFKNESIEASTTVTISDSATSGTWTGSLALAAGDRVSIDALPSGTPAVGSIGTSVKFSPTVDGEANISTPQMSSVPTTGGTSKFQQPFGTATIQTTEGLADVLTPRASIILRKARAWSDFSPGDTKQMLWTINVDTSAAGGLSVDMSNTATTASDLVNSTTISNSNVVWNWKIANNANGLTGLQSPMIAAATYALSDFPAGGAGKGNSNKGKKAGGGALHIQNAAGADCLNIGNPSLDIGTC